MDHIKSNVSIKWIIVSIVVLLVMMLTTTLAGAQEGARVYARPVDAPDNTVVVDIIAENVTDLYGAEFRLTYDPAVVAVQDFKPEQDGVQIEAGTLLPSNQGFVVANQVDEVEGTVIFAMTLLNPAPPVTGNGPLARVAFNILQDTPSTINIEHAKLVAVDLQTIPSQTETFAFGDSSQPAANPPAAAAGEAPATLAPAAPVETASVPVVGEENFPWWIVAAVIMVLGILALGGFLVMDGLKSTAAPDDKKPNTMAGSQTIYRTGRGKEAS